MKRDAIKNLKFQSWKEYINLWNSGSKQLDISAHDMILEISSSEEKNLFSYISQKLFKGNMENTYYLN